MNVPTVDALSPSDHTFPTVDPWWDLYLPATFGELDAVADALEAGEVSLPLARRGDLYAVAARAYAVLGRLVEAERLLEQAVQLGGPEAEALATLVRPDGVRLAERRMGRGRPGLRADAACDRAALRALAGDHDGARADVALAQRLCPGHAEAGRWARFFDETPNPAKALRAARDPRRARRAGVGPVAEAVALLPTRRTGWLSEERYQRRVLGGPPAAAWSAPETGLGRLQDVGGALYFFALDFEYAGVPADHPLVALEIDADTLRARVEEGREAVAAAWALWHGAGEVDAECRSDAAQLLAGLATADPRLGPVGIEAVGWLLENRTASRDLWEGYLAWLLHLVEGAGAGRARALAVARPAHPLAWRMAIETLRAEGCVEEADALCRAARSEPGLAPIARELLETPLGGPFRMVVSGRLAPRWARPSLADARLG